MSLDSQSSYDCLRSSFSRRSDSENRAVGNPGDGSSRGITQGDCLNVKVIKVSFLRFFSYKVSVAIQN